MAQSSTKKLKRANTGLIIALCITAGLFITSLTLWLTNMSKMNNMGLTIESVYERNFYDLVDNINNAEVKLSKVLASNQDMYARKLLGEISKNTNSASYNLSNLPISLNGVDETKKFINQVSGYTSTLCDKLDKGQKLSSDELNTLEDIYSSMATLKNQLSEFNDKFLSQGYNIFQNGNLFDGDHNSFTTQIQGIRGSDVEYPTMIYDGPFADGQLNKKVKGLNGALVSVNVAKQNLKKYYTNIGDDKIEFKGETSGRFDTFDFQINLNDNIKLFAQVTKTAGKILSISGYGDGNDKTISLNDAIIKAKQMAKTDTGITFECVWNDIVGNDAYINLAPIQNKIVLYPDLIKVKVDLSSGEIIGYSASSFYTNHTQRTLAQATYDKANADAKIPAGYNVQMSRICLAPLDYGQEILCYEYQCEKDDITYYIYINANTGITENILRVIETNDGNKLM